MKVPFPPFVANCVDNQARSLAKAAYTLAVSGTNLGQAGITLAEQGIGTANQVRVYAENIDGTPPRVLVDGVFRFFVVNPTQDGKWEATWDYGGDTGYAGHYKDFLYYSLDKGQNWIFWGSRYNDQSHRLQMEPVPYTTIRFAIAGFVSDAASGMKVRATGWQYFDGVGD